MSVNITVKGNQSTPEHKDALALKEIFNKGFSNKQIKGDILIISNVTLFGQDVKDVDIVVIGSLESLRLDIKTRAKIIVSKNFNDNIIKDFDQRPVYVNNFCFVIESKKHRAEDIKLDGLTLIVKYQDRNVKLSDATTQSEKQKYALKSFLLDRLNKSPTLCNFIWLRNVSSESLKELVGGNERAKYTNNYLPSDFSIEYIFQLACIQQIPLMPAERTENGEIKYQNKEVVTKKYATFNCLGYKQNFDLTQMQNIFDLFSRVKEGMGKLTRKKIEQITSKILEDQKYAQAIGEKLVIISGKAGTGKTIKLLKIACDLAQNKGARCLILTYNHALVSDIKRTLALAKIPDGIDDYTVNIQTLHSFFHQLLIGFGIVKDPDDPTKEIKRIPDFFDNYQKYLNELTEYIKEGVIEEKDIQELMKSRHDEVAWDYILIYEAQDWEEVEKELIFEIFGKNKIIIADGVDQLVRKQQKCNWTRALRPERDFRKTHEKKGLRQETNLIAFVNAYALKLGLIWEVEPKNELIGGKIIISTKPYHKELHDRELKRLKEFGNSPYEMLFLVPPRLVTKTKDVNEYGKTINNNKFLYIDEFKKDGISIWDGTSKDLRTNYSVDLNQHRLLQYDSCRGLEGWTVVCLELDEFVRYKIETFKDEPTNELALESTAEKRDKFVFLWSLIPLTRAIDTLIITIKNKNSLIGKKLKEIYSENPDFIEWIE
jgi:hypothetical protein